MPQLLPTQPTTTQPAQRLTVPQLRQFLEERPLIAFLEPTGNISNPVATEIIRGEWPRPGATRRLTLADGHFVIERVIDNREDLFRYQLFVFTSATGRGVEQIVGEQRFVATENGSRFEWTSRRYFPSPLTLARWTPRPSVRRRMALATGLNAAFVGASKRTS